jgi:hypothetical protein
VVVFWDHKELTHTTVKVLMMIRQVLVKVSVTNVHVDMSVRLVNSGIPCDPCHRVVNS